MLKLLEVNLWDLSCDLGVVISVVVITIFGVFSSDLGVVIITIFGVL